MAIDLRTSIHNGMGATVKPAVYYLLRPNRLLRSYQRENLRSDLGAAVTVAIILLPQAIAFAMIAELPPSMGLYTAIVGAIVGALWGASNQVQTGPTNALSLLVFSSLQQIAEPGTMDFFIAAGLMAVMAGLFQLALGLARMGILVNFVSHSVIVGFASGAGILIAVKQFSPLLGLQFPSRSLLETIGSIITHLPQTHIQTAILGIGTMLLITLLRKLNSKLPAAFISMVLASTIVFIFKWDQAGVAVIGQLPSELPPLVKLPLFDLQRLAQLSSGALAVGAIGLVQTTAISRSIATETGQRLDSNQEFIGQGLVNIFTGFFSGYAASGSFSVSAVNLNAGAKTPIASIFSSIFVLVAMLALGPLAAYLPRAALAGVLINTAYRMINRDELKRIIRGTHGDAIIMTATLLGTLFLDLEFAVFLGILLSFAHYLLRSSIPRVQSVLPTKDFAHFTPQPEQSDCPQLGILDIQGNLYFGSARTVEEAIFKHAGQHPEQRNLLIRMIHVNHCDFNGIHMLENVVRSYRTWGGDVFLVRVHDQVRELMHTTGFDKFLGLDHFLSEDNTIAPIFHRELNPSICIYECPLRVFKECKQLPKQLHRDKIPGLHNIPNGSVIEVSPQQLWKQLYNGNGTPPPKVIDVREPREFQKGHVAEAQLISMPRILEQSQKLPNNQQIVLVCQSGCRSRRAAHALQQMGIMNVSILGGGMLAWKTYGLLETAEL